MATSSGQARVCEDTIAPLPSAVPKRATVQEIVPRDGLRLGSGVMTTADNIAIVGALSATGVPRLQLNTVLLPSRRHRDRPRLRR